jgi:two-component system response regulator AtoC
MTLAASRPLRTSRQMQAGSPSPQPSLDILFGRTPAMNEIKRKIDLVAKTDVPVLLQGESGTGKELCAQLIHSLSHRSQHAFVKVSCPAIPGPLLETELFGYEKGAFTGANATKQGRVEQADRGTLLLDEIGSLDSPVQAKLLQLLQDGSFMRVGAHASRTVSTRIISIANHDLRREVERGTFRLDFLYRINAITLDLPPLRQRREDLPDLVAYFCRRHASGFKLAPRYPSKGLLRLMHGYDWPGNIRQLDNMLRSFILIGSEDLLVSEMVAQPKGPDEISAQVDLSQPLSLKQITKKATRDLERQIIVKVLQANGWNRQKTARKLQISYRSLLYKLNEAPEPAMPRKTVPTAAVQQPTSDPPRPSLGMTH